jgi:fatty acid desaturase
VSMSAETETEVLPHSLVADLHNPRPAVFWADLTVSALVGWGAFAIAVTAPWLSSVSLAACLVSALALYRGVCFTHELAHLRRRVLPGFETAWNVLFGVPLLLPSFTYLGVHQSHHSLSTYGTKDDPEYLPFADSRRLMLIFGVQSSVVLPVLLVVRFLMLAPLGLVIPRFHRVLETHASSFAMNPQYRRTVAPDMAAKMKKWELGMLAFWGGALALTYAGAIPMHVFVVWFGVLIFISFLNTARVLGSHEYETDGSARSRQAQLRDSIDTPGGPWTELWAPVGLRYHALHHYYPGIPYHNLGTAYQRIVKTLPAQSFYMESTSPGLYRSLTVLYMKAKTRGAALAKSLLRTPGA